MKTLFLLDEQCVASSSGVTFHLNPARKHPQNPVLLPGEPHEWDSLQVSWPGTVLYSAADRKFCCWYSGLDVIQSKRRFWDPGYAESDDGVHWTKITRLDRNADQFDPRAVFENPLPDAPPSRRFGAYWMEHNWDASRGQTYLRFRVGWSPDGVNWKLGDLSYNVQPIERAAFQDFYSVLYDPDEPDPDYRVKVYTQFMRPRGWGGGPKLVRHIGLVHGADFTELKDAPNPMMLAPEEGIDEELHFASVKKIGGTYLMLFESDRFSKNPIDGDLRLAVSDDGRRFRRVHRHSPLVPTGPKGSWDENLLVTTGSAMQQAGDQFYIFYFGCPNTYNSWPAEYAVSYERRGSMFAPAYLGLATLPRDRFGYVTGDGTITTHPLRIGQDGLWLNAEGEGIAVIAIDSSGRSIAFGKCGEQRRQSVYRQVVWSGSAPASDCQLTIELARQCKLFSIAW